MTGLPPDHPTREVTDPDGLAQVYAALLVPSFPPSELVPPEWLTDGVASGRVAVLVAEDASGPVATSVSEQLGEGVVLLTYFATRADMRGRGIGSALFARMLHDVRARDRPTLVVAEVERPDRHTGSEAFGDPAARLRFYGRHGARVLDLPYFQPAIDEATDPVHGMLLLALWADPRVEVTAPDGGVSVPGPGLVATAIGSILEDETVPSPEGAALRAAAGVPLVRVYAVEDYPRVAPSR